MPKGLCLIARYLGKVAKVLVALPGLSSFYFARSESQAALEPKSEFLKTGNPGPVHQPLLRLIGGLARNDIGRTGLHR